MEGRIIPRSKPKCTQRFANSETVAMRTASRILSPQPDTEIKGDVEVLESSPFGETTYVYPKPF